MTSRRPGVGCRGDLVGDRPVVTGPRRRMSAEARREQIVRAARNVFIRSGFAGSRTRDLAAEAGVTEALIYQHFASKDELLDAAVGDPLAQAVAGLIEFSGQPPEQFDVTAEIMQERTRAFVEDLLEAMDDIAPLLTVMLGGDHDMAKRYFRQRLAPSLDAIRDVIAANLPSWNHRDFDPEVLGRLVFGMAWFTTLSDQLAGRTTDREELASMIATMIIFGLDTSHQAPGA